MRQIQNIFQNLNNQKVKYFYKPVSKYLLEVLFLNPKHYYQVIMII